MSIPKIKTPLIKEMFPGNMGGDARVYVKLLPHTLQHV